MVDNVSGTTSVGWTQTSRIQVRYKVTWFQCATEDWDSPRHWTDDRIPIKITINCSQATELWVLGSSENCHREPTRSASTDLSSSRGRGDTPRKWVENTSRIMMFLHSLLMLISWRLNHNNLIKLLPPRPKQRACAAVMTSWWTSKPTLRSLVLLLVSVSDSDVMAEDIIDAKVMWILLLDRCVLTGSCITCSPFSGKCPTCYHNFRKNFCDVTCHPRSSVWFDILSERKEQYLWVWDPN